MRNRCYIIMLRLRMVLLSAFIDISFCWLTVVFVGEKAGC